MAVSSKEKIDYKIFGSILLVSGCCIGAGMLGLPVISSLAGFIPSSLVFIVGWLFMAATGLLLLEANLWFNESASMVTLAGRTLGIGGKIVAWVGFLFLFYALIVAYISGTGELISDVSMELAGVSIPSWAAGCLVAAIFGVLIYAGTAVVDECNRYLMLGLVAAYAILILLGLPYVDSSNLGHVDWKASLFIMPPVIISFGYHNLVPTLTTYLHKNVKQLRLVILAGSAIPLAAYLLWEAVVLGLTPLDGDGGLREALQIGNMATSVLKNTVSSPYIIYAAHAFALFSIVTSFLSVALSFVDFLADGLHAGKTGSNRALLCLAVLLPALIFALIYPKIFLMALNYAGAYGAVVLFGILPVAMVYAGRYRQKRGGKELLPGGRAALGLVLAMAIGIMILQSVNQ